MQCQALTLLSAAALYSAEGHEQVLESLDHLKKTRRRMHRFGWLVEACNQGADDADAGDDLTFEDRAVTGIQRKKDPNNDPEDSKSAQRAAAVQVVSCCLILINAVIGFPENLTDRVKLRSEFIRLSLLDVLQQLHREKHVDVVRQVGVFELGLGLGLG